MALAIIAAAGTGIVGALSYQSTQSRLMTEIDRSLINATGRFLDRRGGVLGDRPGSSNNLRLAIPERPLGIEQFVVQLVDPSGDVLAATDGVTIPVPSTDMGSTQGDGTPWISTERANDGSMYRLRSFATPIGVVRVGRDLAETENVLADLRERTVLLSSLVAALAAAVGWLIALRVTSRLRHLSLAAENVAATGRLTLDVPLSGHDEVGRLGRSFDEMLVALSRSKEQQRRLVEDAGHELRTPLTSLRTNLDVLKRHPAMDDGMRRQILAEIDRDTSELTSLVEEVVAVAADRHATELPEPVRLSEAVERVADKARRRTSKDIVVTHDDSIAMVRLALIERAISNLIDNALKFDVSDAPVEVNVHRGTIAVADRGPGIPAPDLAHVFDRFHRSIEARSTPGSGLGLSIVAEVAAMHDGTVFARNRIGGGAEVGLNLPNE